MLVPFAFLLTGPTTYSIDWEPVEGEQHFYHVSVHFDYGGPEVVFDSDLRTKVLSVGPDGSYRLETQTSNAIAQSGGDKQDLPPQQAVVQRFSRRGVPTETGAHDPDPFSDLLDHLTEYQTPGRQVAVGETWMNATSGPKTAWFGEPRIAYNLAGFGRGKGGPFAHVTFTTSRGLEQQVAKGELILSRPRNSLSVLKVAIPHFQPEGATQEAEVSVEVSEIPKAKGH